VLLKHARQASLRKKIDVRGLKQVPGHDAVVMTDRNRTDVRHRYQESAPGDSCDFRQCAFILRNVFYDLRCDRTFELIVRERHGKTAVIKFDKLLHTGR
jgi:hypothetical protein